MTMNIKKLIPEATIPDNAHQIDAGYDLFTIEEYELKPGERKLFKTGIAMAIPTGYFGRVSPRSGLAVKKGIDVLAGTIDCFTENCTVKTPFGDKFIKELKIDDIVFSVNEKLEIEKDFISAIVNIGEKDILKIETDNGILEITLDTFVYTDTGLKLAKNLTENDKILTF